MAEDFADKPTAPEYCGQNGSFQFGVSFGEGPRSPEFPGLGDENRAPSFDGIGSVAIGGVFDVLEALHPSAITMEAWIKNERLSERQLIYKNNISEQLNGFAISLEDNSIQVTSRSTPTDDLPNANPAQTPFNTTGQWRYVVGVVDYTNDEMRVYIDGQFAGMVDRPYDQPAYTASSLPPTSPDFIGRVTGGVRLPGLYRRSGAVCASTDRGRDPETLLCGDGPTPGRL